MVDITERKQAEAALRQANEQLHASEERLRFAPQAASFGCYDLDLVTDQAYRSPEFKSNCRSGTPGGVPGRRGPPAGLPPPRRPRLRPQGGPGEPRSAGNRHRGSGVPAAGAMFLEDFEGRVLPFDMDAAIAYADIFAARRRAGRPTATIDLTIASVARSHNASVVTRDISGFEGCSLRVINPWDAT